MQIKQARGLRLCNRPYIVCSLDRSDCIRVSHEPDQTQNVSRYAGQSEESFDTPKINPLLMQGQKKRESIAGGARADDGPHNSRPEQRKSTAAKWDSIVDLYVKFPM